MVGIIMKKHNRAVFHFWCNTLTNAIGRGVVFPIERVNIRNKSNIIFLLFSPLERGDASLYSPLSIAFRFETQLEVSFQIIKFFAMSCVLLNLQLNLKKCKREQSGVEWADDRVSPCKKQGKTLISETVCFRFRSVRIVVWELGFFIAYYCNPFGKSHSALDFTQ